MKIGFIGTGTIAASMIDGLMASQLKITKIVISPRNAQLAERLAADYDKVTIAADNQAVIDATDHVFLCLRSQIAETVLKSLKFKKEQQVISVLAMAKAKDVGQWIGHETIYRAVPLPFVANLKGITPVYPDNEFLRTMFDALGGTMVLDNEDQFNVFMTAGSLMGVYFNFVETSNQWLLKQGLSDNQTAAYLSMLFGNLADEMRKSDKPSFAALEEEFSTKGGTNELVSKQFSAKGGQNALQDALDMALIKIKN